jgi:predicted nucleotidyltransferase
MNLQNDEILKQMIDLIVSKTSPSKIILFGSRARGDYKEDSDYDILVIMDKLEDSISFTANLYTQLRYANLPRNVDFLAISSTKYDQIKSQVGYIYKTIDKEGKIIYDINL